MFLKMALMCDPIGEAECKNLEALAPSKGQSSTAVCPDPRIGFQDAGVVKLKVPPHLARVIKERVDSCRVFHSFFEHHWLCWGHFAVKVCDVGVTPFGDVSLNPEAGQGHDG